MAIAIDHIHSLRQVPRVVGFTDRGSMVREEVDPTPLGIARRPVALREPVLAYVPVRSSSVRRSAEVYEQRRSIAMLVLAAAVAVCGLVGFVRGGAELSPRQVTVVPSAPVELP
jgi:hypothetical protein